MDTLSGVTKHVDAVSSGAEAVAAVKQHDQPWPYDLVFMDWRMPGIDGLEATRRIKQDLQLRKPPAIVMVTAFGREEVRDEAEKLGIDGFLVKPVTKSMLVDMYRLQSPLALQVLSDLKIIVSETPRGNPAGEIYGKVLESVAETPGRARIWFTSTSPELKAWLSAVGDS